MLLVWSGLLVGAIPRMGKTYAARLAAAAATLDPHVQLYVFDGKGGKDWQPFEAVAHRYGSGIRRAVVEHLVQVLRELVAEMNRRYEVMRTLPHDRCPEAKLTPVLARDKRLGMPLVLLCIDEVQRYLEDAEFGATILALLVELAKVAPAAGIMLVLATQRPDSKTLPEALRGNIGTRLALKVMNWQASECTLGAGTYPELDASKLLNSHKGVGILLGADDGELAEAGGQTVRTHLLDLEALQRIVERGRELRIKAGTLTGVAAGEDLIQEEPARAFLDDVAAVFGPGEAKLWSEVIASRLAERWPETYDGWSATDLGTRLGRHGIRTIQVWGQTPEGAGANRKGIALEAVMEALSGGGESPVGR
jgi:S-DNA-T family DNA segregation ATPase FtsK/SpoIIIE